MATQPGPVDGGAAWGGRFPEASRGVVPGGRPAQPPHGAGPWGGAAGAVGGTGPWQSPPGAAGGTGPWQSPPGAAGGTGQWGRPGEPFGQAPPAPAPPAAGVKRRRRRPLLAALLAVLGLVGLVFAGNAIFGQLMPRKFTPAQRRQIEAWEVARRWRVIPKTRIFPFSIHYRLADDQFGFAVPLKLTARRLDIARQAACAGAAGSASLAQLLGSRGCQVVLRATYTDASSSLVLTVGIAVLRTPPGATTAAQALTTTAPDTRGAVTIRPVLRTVRVGGTPAAAFGDAQRQVSWAISAGPYLVLATVGYADGRPHQPVATNAYAYMEMTSLAAGVADGVARPLGAPPPVPHCPGAPAC